jgi:hypothetical protein
MRQPSSRDHQAHKRHRLSGFKAMRWPLAQFHDLKWIARGGSIVAI